MANIFEKFFALGRDNLEPFLYLGSGLATVMYDIGWGGGGGLLCPPLVPHIHYFHMLGLGSRPPPLYDWGQGQGSLQYTLIRLADK